jgi:hypothetical protein
MTLGFFRLMTADIPDSTELCVIDCDRYDVVSGEVADHEIQSVGLQSNDTETERVVALAIHPSLDEA